MPSWLDVGLVLAVFWTPSVGVFLYLILREVGRLRRELRLLKRELRTSSAEGFPPPDPPTTDQPPDSALR